MISQLHQMANSHDILPNLYTLVIFENKTIHSIRVYKANLDKKSIDIKYEYSIVL